MGRRRKAPMGLKGRCTLQEALKEAIKVMGSERTRSVVDKIL